MEAQGWAVIWQWPRWQGEGSSPDACVSGSQPRVVSTMPLEAGPGICPGPGEPHASRVHLMITQEVQALGLTNPRHRKGEGRARQEGVSRASSLKALSFPSSHRMPGALQKRDSFVFLPSSHLPLAFLLGLLRATGYSLCQERRKERGREEGEESH